LLWRFFRDPNARLMLALYWGYSLPMLLTSNVHIGRLVFIVPVLAIIVALPIRPIVRWLLKRQPRDYRPKIYPWASFAVGAVIVLIGAVPSLNDWSVEFPRARMELVTDQIVDLTREPPTEQLVYVFGDAGGYEIESLRVAELEMSLHGYLRFVDLREGVERGTGPIPLLYGAMLERIGDPGSIPGYCTNHYLVEPESEQRFFEEMVAVALPECGQPLRYDILVH
jgi:hypothetical protein